METKEKRTRQDEIIEYLLNSKRELQEEIKNDVHTKEFQDILSFKGKDVMVVASKRRSE